MYMLVLFSRYSLSVVSIAHPHVAPDNGIYTFRLRLQKRCLFADICVHQWLDASRRSDVLDQKFGFLVTCLASVSVKVSALDINRQITLTHALSANKTGKSRTHLLDNEGIVSFE